MTLGSSRAMLGQGSMRPTGMRLHLALLAAADAAYHVLYYTIIYYTILYYTILCYAILYNTIQYYTKLYYTLLYPTICCVNVCLGVINRSPTVLRVSDGYLSFVCLFSGRTHNCSPHVSDHY